MRNKSGTDFRKVQNFHQEGIPPTMLKNNMAPYTLVRREMKANYHVLWNEKDRAMGHLNGLTIQTHKKKKTKPAIAFSPHLQSLSIFFQVNNIILLHLLILPFNAILSISPYEGIS
jgi:hypothetical protein